MVENLIFGEKYIEPSLAGAAIAGWKRSGLRVVLALGCFDLLHVGCVRFLSEAASLGDRLLVGVFDDMSVSVSRGNGRPVLALHHRIDLVAAIEQVHSVTAISLDNLKGRVAELAPDIVVVGKDHSEVELCRPTSGMSNCEFILTGGLTDICSDWLVKRIQEKQ